LKRGSGSERSASTPAADEWTIILSSERERRRVSLGV
jgi:hypothetical protein